LFFFSSKRGRNEALSVFGFEVPLMSGTTLPKTPRTACGQEAHAVQFNSPRLLGQEGEDRDLFHDRIFARQRPVPPSYVSTPLSVRPPCKHCGHWLEHLTWEGTTCRITIIASAHPGRILCTNVFQEQSDMKRRTLISSLKE